MGEGNRNRIRQDPITGEWVIMAVDRGGRPGAYRQNGPRHPHAVLEGDCAFCPGNEGRTPPADESAEPFQSILWIPRRGSPDPATEWDLRIVPNKYPFLKIENEYKDPEQRLDFLIEGMYSEIAAFGAHNVIIETPYHGDEVAATQLHLLENLFSAIGQQAQYLACDPHYRYIYAFKNCGKDAGSTIEHAHTQLMALPYIPYAAKNIMFGLKRYAAEHDGACGYCDEVRQDMADGRRVVATNDDFVVLAPKASKYTFSLYVLPLEHKSFFEELTPGEIRSLAAIIQDAMKRVDSVLGEPHFNFFFKTAPVNYDINASEGGTVHFANPHYHHLGIEIKPKQSELAGAEIGAGLFICTVFPEDAAAYLRDGRPLKEQTG